MKGEQWFITRDNGDSPDAAYIGIVDTLDNADNLVNERVESDSNQSSTCSINIARVIDHCLEGYPNVILAREYVLEWSYMGHSAEFGWYKATRQVILNDEPS